MCVEIHVSVGVNKKCHDELASNLCQETPACLYSGSGWFKLFFCIMGKRSREPPILVAACLVSLQVISIGIHEANSCSVASRVHDGPKQSGSGGGWGVSAHRGRIDDTVIILSASPLSVLGLGSMRSAVNKGRRCLTQPRFSWALLFLRVGVLWLRWGGNGKGRGLADSREEERKGCCIFCLLT